MWNICIHYFSGTGNTAHCVKLIAEKLTQEGHEVNIVQVNKDILPPFNHFDYHIIAFPVLSWAPPALIKRYVRKFPKINATEVAILAVNGSIINNGKIIKGYTGQALEELECILKKRKYRVFLTGNASFPDNWTQVTNPCSPEDVEVIFKLGDTEVQNFINKFLAKEKELYRCGIFNRLWSYTTALLFSIIGRRALGKFFIADENCTGCEICVKACPVRTIQMEHKKPYWNSQCEDCNRCINICPERAIQVSLPMLILQSVINVILSIWVVKALLKYIPLLIQTNHVFIISIEILAIIAAYVLLLWISFVPIDNLMRKLLRFKSIRHFFSISYTQKYRRYKAPGFNPLKKSL
jgi:NAD-dependent dihydropyrimidine dehydrogenase PreA subunit/menaquinone-dependent protoporphyrinogen IX oxidase